MPSFNKAVTAAIAGAFAFNSLSMPASAVTKDELTTYSYQQVKGTGLAARCPEVSGEGKDSINLAGGKKYSVVDFCLEPRQFQVEEEFGTANGRRTKQFVDAKMLTRQTYTLSEIVANLEVKDGKAVLTEDYGLDYAAGTVQMPGGERHPLMLSIKKLVAKSSTAGPIKPGFDLSGSYYVPGYRGGTFLDPKTRGTTSGYDVANAFPALQTSLEGDAKLFKENNKLHVPSKGEAEFVVNKVNAEEGSFSGVYVAKQETDNDMGAHDGEPLLIKGVFYGRLEQ
eukprot:scaffold5121_cov223-Ochromonas_danica.AAC.13